jgi:broad specificity phosphatase PhoE
MPRLFVPICLLLLGACAAAPSAPPASDSDLLSALPAGGHVILFRHAATDWRNGDSDPDHLDVCATQRNLDARGRAQAAMIGAAFRALRIPVGTVETSEYCRCVDTARIAFGYSTVSVDLTSVNRVDPEEGLRRVAAIRTRIAVAPSPGTNTVLVSHMAMIREATGVALEEGEAAVFRPLPGGGVKFVGTLSAEELSRHALFGPPRSASR